MNSFTLRMSVISLLLANKIEDARRRYDQYWEIHDDIEWKELGDFRYQEIKNIMLAAPVSLEDLEANVIQRARVAVALEIFYPDEVDDNLITNYNLERFSVKLTDKIIINHIETNARIRLYLAFVKSEHGEFKQCSLTQFDSKIKPCNLFRKKEGQVFSVDSIPQLPLSGCTQECDCRIEPIII